MGESGRALPRIDGAQGNLFPELSPPIGSVISEGEERKNKGTERVLRRAREGWRTRALELLLEVSEKSREFTVDDFRELAEDRQIGRPHHVNAWSALVRLGSRRGWFHRTGEFRPSRRAEAHSRMIPVYRSDLP
ncbi:MAG: hypothetical protein AMS19_02480 [Gemmatimonas sp. SG8_23]|nr:MAG: hypothetical protein AMS19_02480 [Gemmatimonas sp. SG8_23]